MSYYSEPDSHIRDKVIAVLRLSNYATKKKLDHAKHLIYLLNRFYYFETEVDKLDINKLINVPTNLNNLIAKVDDLDISKLNTVPVNSKK